LKIRGNHARLHSRYSLYEENILKEKLIIIL